MFPGDLNVPPPILLIYLLNMIKYHGLNNNNQSIALNEILLISVLKKNVFTVQYHFLILNGPKSGI